MSPIVAHVRWHELSLEEFIQLDLYQDVIPQTRAVRPVGGEGFLGATPQGLERVRGQRGADLDQSPPSVSLDLLVAELPVDPRFCLSLRLLCALGIIPRPQCLMHDVRDQAKGFDPLDMPHRPLHREGDILYAKPLTKELFHNGGIPGKFTLRGLGPEEFVEALCRGSARWP